MCVCGGGGGEGGGGGGEWPGDEGSPNSVMVFVKPRP